MSSLHHATGFGLALHSPASPTGPLPCFPWATAAITVSFWLLCCGRGRRRAKLSFLCSPVILLVAIKFHMAGLPGVQGLCDPGWEGCADTESPITLGSLHSPGEHKLLSNF